MRFLHTGDWHLGKNLRAVSRGDESEKALNEILDIARREAVDCLLVAGDVFDSAAPPPEAERLLFGFLRELFGYGIPAVIIGGNHDHPKRLQALSGVLELVNIHVRGDPVRAQKGGVLRLGSRDGSEMASIAMLPWVDERRVISYDALLERRSAGQFADRVAAIGRSLTRGLPSDTINLLLAHIMIDGAQVGGGERELHLSPIYAVKPEALPDTPSYVALGHVHKPQEIRRAPAKTHYAGSLLQLDFGERGQEKSVVLIEAHPGRPAHVETVPLSAGRRLRDLEGTLTELQALAADAGEDYLRVRVHVDGPTPGLTRQVRELLPNALEVVPVYPDRERTESDQRLRTLSPDQLLAEYHQTTYGSAVPAPVLDLFRRLQEEVDRAAP